MREFVGICLVESLVGEPVAVAAGIGRVCIVAACNHYVVQTVGSFHVAKLENVPLALLGFNHAGIELVVSCLEFRNYRHDIVAGGVAFAQSLELVDGSLRLVTVSVEGSRGEVAYLVAVGEVLHVELSHCNGRVGNAYVVEVGDGLVEQVDGSLRCIVCEVLGLSLLYCVEQVGAYVLVRGQLRGRSSVNAGNGQEVDFGVLGHSVVVELVVGNACEDFEAHVFVSLQAVDDNVNGVGGVVVEVARGDVFLLENGNDFFPFARVVAYRYAQFRRCAVPCGVVTLLVVECHGVGQACLVFCLEAQVVCFVNCLCIPCGVPERAVVAVDKILDVLAFVD